MSAPQTFTASRPIRHSATPAPDTSRRRLAGLIFQGTANVPGVFRIDHDQAFQQTTNLRYQRKKDGPWADLIWRYDSGLVVTGVPDVHAATLLTPNQQVDIGFACNGIAATAQSPDPELALASEHPRC